LTIAREMMQRTAPAERGAAEVLLLLLLLLAAACA
jgi:hypothetical protein